MNRIPNVSVLMSTYNGGKYLKEQIDSILNQKGCNIELLVRDDGSTDDTLDILNEYKHNSKLQWYIGQNLKPAKSFFDLLVHSPSSDYYAFSDQDDIWDNDKIISAISLISKVKKPAVYYCNARISDDTGLPTGKLVYDDSKINPNLLTVLTAGGAMGCTMVMNYPLINIIKEVGIVPNKIIMHDCFVQGLAAAVDGLCYYDEKPHMNYRQHGANVVGSKKGVLNGLIYRLRFIFEEHEVSISNNAETLIKYYSDYIPEHNMRYINIVLSYKDSFMNRLSLCVNRELRFRNVKDSLFMRFSILIGKR